MSFYPAMEQAKLREFDQSMRNYWSGTPPSSDSRRTDDMLLQHGEQQQQHQQQQAQQAQQQQQHQQWPIQCTSSADQPPSMQTLSDSWLMVDEPRGLGLSNDAISNAYYTGITSTAVASTLAESPAWNSNASSMTPGPTSVAGISSRKDSAIDQSQGAPAVQPASMLWGSMAMGKEAMMAAHRMSPASQSEYSSTGSQLSFTSSPFSNADAMYSARQSPVIKVENSIELSPAYQHYMPNARSASHTMLVDTGDLIANGDDVTACLQPAKMDYNTVDAKPRLEDHEQRMRASSSSSHRTSIDDMLEQVNRPRRRFTKPEEATCNCLICGKLFQRCYNLKAHMETHDPERPHPHPCSYEGCERMFVRRADLARHEASVHVKRRDHPCPLCNSAFSRRDTLRRHVEDGCPKRMNFGKRSRKPRGSRARSSPSAAAAAAAAAARSSAAADEEPFDDSFASAAVMHMY